MSGKRWGRGWPHCQKHQGTDRKHLARGLCGICYMEETRAGTINTWPTKPPAAPAPGTTEQEAPVAQKQAPRWHYNHAACKGCGTTARPHHSDGLCTQCVMERQGLTPAQATRQIAQGREALEAPLSPPQRERLGVLLERKRGEHSPPVVTVVELPVAEPAPEPEPARGGLVDPAAGLARLDAAYQAAVAEVEPARGGLVDPASDPPAWVGTTGGDPVLPDPEDAARTAMLAQHAEQIVGVVEQFAAEGVAQPGEQIGGFVDEAGEPVPTEPAVCLEAVPGEERQVRLRATLPDDHARTFPLGIYGPNPGDDLRPARPTAIDRIMALADCTTEELLAEINGRVAAMQRQWQDSLDLAARYAQIAQIVGGK